MEKENNSSTGQVDWRVIGRIEYLKNKPCPIIELISRELKNLEQTILESSSPPLTAKILEESLSLNTLCNRLIEDTSNELKQIKLEAVAKKVQMIFKAKEVIVAVLAKKLQKYEPKDHEISSAFPLTAVKPLCAFCRANIDFQKLEQIKNELDQGTNLKIYDNSIPIPIWQEEEDETTDLQTMVARFLSRKNQILSAKVSNIDILLNEALDAMESSTKVLKHYKTLSNQELVLLLSNSRAVVDSVCKQIDQQFRGSVQKQLSSIIVTLCKQYYIKTRAIERAAMQSHETQTIQSKNGLSTRSLEMKIEVLKKELTQKTVEIDHLLENVVELKESALKTRIHQSNAIRKFEYTIQQMDKTILQKNERITQLEGELSEANAKLAKPMPHIPPNSPTERKSSIEPKNSMSRFSKVLVHKNDFKSPQHTISKQVTGRLTIQKEIQYHNEPPQTITETSSRSDSESNSNNEEDPVHNKQTIEQLKKEIEINGSASPNNVPSDPTHEARISVARVSKVLSSTTSLALFANHSRESKNGRFSGIMQNPDLLIASIKRQESFMSATTPISPRLSLMAGHPSPKQSTSFTSPSPVSSQPEQITPLQETKDNKYSLTPAVNIMIDHPRHSIRSSLSACNFQKKLSGINLSQIPNALSFKRTDQHEDVTPPRSSFIKNGGGGSSFNKYYQNIMNLQNAMKKINNSSASVGKNAIQVFGFSSLAEFHAPKKSNRIAPYNAPTTPRIQSQQKKRSVNSEENIAHPDQRQNIPNTFSMHSEKKKVSPKTVELLSAKLFPKFNNAMKEAKKAHPHSKRQTKKKVLKQILRNDFDIEDMNLFIGVSEAYQFEQSNQHNLKEQLDLQNLVPAKLQQELKEVYHHIQSLRRSNPNYYFNLKNFLKHPYLTAVSKLCNTDKHDILKWQTFEELMIKLLILHRKCQCYHRSFYCNHIKSFFNKIGYRTEVQNGVSIRSLLPILSDKSEKEH